jgi:hypothetical protein
MSRKRSIFSSGQQAVEIDVFLDAKPHGVIREIGQNCFKQNQLPSFLDQNKTLT